MPLQVVKFVFNIVPHRTSASFPRPWVGCQCAVWRGRVDFGLLGLACVVHLAAAESPDTSRPLGQGFERSRQRTRPLRLYRRSRRAGCEPTTSTVIMTAESTAIEYM